ncbi:hypothetical protein [Cylindrospermopsis raciborskii]|uniref:hypothetical protein n=1 Tax=Cylindrospermopsis raciborskii TaxID=77022 RepID=UPI0008DE02C7|nr:hypothetical protein [Cylindrospermopsis raciborskii]NLQ05443.1 hypothetical protein [Cylindrospermopsis raciborskii MVCC19]OHY36450.1 hypothetical protein BCV64_01380 [Cylindrospermopsis raciborskii MVCC14]
MNKWYKITPSGSLTLGNLTPVGQNSGLVGCRWPPNGNQLAATLNLPRNSQMWGPFWGYENNLYLPLPQTAYTVTGSTSSPYRELYRMFWDRGWQLQDQHKEIEHLGGGHLIRAEGLKQLWQQGKLRVTDEQLKPLPWKTLTLSHNRRENFQVVEEGGFYAEKTILLDPGWSIFVKIMGEELPYNHGILGAGRTPVSITGLTTARTENWEYIGETNGKANSAILLTPALWSNPRTKTSLPYPPEFPPVSYAAELGKPWQTWKTLPDEQTRLTPGEWLTPAGAVYKWQTPPLTRSGPYPDSFNRDKWGYGHLWFYEDTLKL